MNWSHFFFMCAVLQAVLLVVRNMVGTDTTAEVRSQALAILSDLVLAWMCL